MTKLPRSLAKLDLSSVQATKLSWTMLFELSADIEDILLPFLDSSQSTDGYLTWSRYKVSGQLVQVNFFVRHTPSSSSHLFCFVEYVSNPSEEYGFPVEYRGYRRVLHQLSENSSIGPLQQPLSCIAEFVFEPTDQTEPWFPVGGLFDIGGKDNQAIEISGIRGTKYHAADSQEPEFRYQLDRTRDGALVLRVDFPMVAEWTVQLPRRILRRSTEIAEQLFPRMEVETNGPRS